LRRRPRRRTISIVNCPKCNDKLLGPLEVGDVMLDRCEECAGIWFDHGELEAIVGAEVASTLEPVDDPEGSSVTKPCPRCAVHMRPVSAAQDPSRPVRVDRCPSCMGLWLDRSRLRAIEDSRIVQTARELFLGAEPDARAVDELPDGDREVVQKMADLLDGHGQRTALLSFISRTG